jgi:C1A family cysteine protease
MIKNRTLGLRRSHLDLRDHPYNSTNQALAESVDLREWDSLVEHQGDIGSCAAHAVTSAYELMVKRQYPDKFYDLSRLFVYYNTRKLENSISRDVGVIELRNTLKTVHTWGVCKELLWPYDPYMLYIQPNTKAYIDAANRKISQYRSVDTVEEVLDALANNRPVVIGLEIFTDFMDVGQDGKVTMPAEGEESLGGHAMTLVGYNQKDQTVTAKNSFGPEWGNNGYCYLPWAYVEKYVFEKWCFDIQIT